MTKIISKKTRPRHGVIVINIEIHEDDGLFVVTSPQFPEINVAHPNIHTIFDDLPNIIKAICHQRYGEEMMVVPADWSEETTLSRPWVAIPEIQTVGYDPALKAPMAAFAKASSSGE